MLVVHKPRLPINSFPAKFNAKTGNLNPPLFATPCCICVPRNPLHLGGQSASLTPGSYTTYCPCCPGKYLLAGNFFPLGHPLLPQLSSLPRSQPLLLPLIVKLTRQRDSESTASLRRRNVSERATQTDSQQGESPHHSPPEGGSSEKMAAGNARIIRYVLLAFVVSFARSGLHALELTSGQSV